MAEAGRLEQAASSSSGAAELVDRSEALLEIIGAIAADYERQKRARSLLDFDDLVERLGGAAAPTSAQGMWVRYKLDSGISHILVDEGQDTNPDQRDVISAQNGEFFSGDSAETRPRTLFEVGDQKQSIFSFQGADPEAFVELGRRGVLLGAARCKLEMTQLKLHFSFRTLDNLLKAVDRVFARPDLQDGGARGEPEFAHSTARAEAAAGG